MKTNLFFTVSACLLIVGFSSCEKAEYEVVSNFNIRLASSAFNAEQFNVQLQDVKVNINDTTWLALNTPAKTYNVLDYQNGSDTLVSTGKLPATSIVKRVKITFSNIVSVKLNNKENILPNGAPSEVILEVGRKLNRNQENLKILIEPSRSLIINADGSYSFKPSVTIIK